MREWRTVFVLLAIVVLLGVLLGVKIINNTPEKQLAKLEQQYEKQKENENKTEMQLHTDSAIELIEDSSGALLSVVVFVVIILFYMVVSYKIYYKLGISTNLLKWYIALPILLAIFTVALKSVIITILLAIATLIVNVILTVMMYKIIGVNPWLLLVGLIPYVGSIVSAIVTIIAICKLADYFGKGTGFKLGLIFASFIFLPILAFSAE